jgi:hypothetical protein
MLKSIKIVVIILLILTAIIALIAGGIFILYPSGQKMGMTSEYLIYSPFRSFLLPGIVLFIVNGVFNLFTALLSIGNHYRANTMITFQGVLLCGWIVMQVLLVRDINTLHIVMFGIGVILFLYGSISHHKVELA